MVLACHAVQVAGQVGAGQPVVLGQLRRRALEGDAPALGTGAGAQVDDVVGVRDHREELDGIIEQFSQGWKLSRISRTALAVLRMALYEILYMPEIPAAASINEAIELAKGFDEPETVRFINGILGGFMRSRGEAASEAPAAESATEE